MRRIFGEIINELANKDKNIILVVGDIGYGIFDKFRKNVRDVAYVNDVSCDLSYFIYFTH